MKPESIAKVLPTNQGGGRSIGTGYPISNDLILTARHVVIYKERDTSVAIEIEWPDLKGSDDKSLTAKVTEIVEFGEQYDIALLKCEITDQAQDTSLTVASLFPAAHEKWESHGYAQIGKVDKSETRKKVPAMGRFHPPGSDHTISLTSESDALEKAGWCGISGAPVFNGNQLYAVLVETPKNRQECFTAVLIPWLIKNHLNFAQAIGIDNETYQNYLAKQRQQIGQLLVDMKGGKVFDELGKKLGLLTQTLTPENLGKQLFTNFDEYPLPTFDVLLQASADGLKQDASLTVLKQVETLFFLFASLMAPKSKMLKQAFHRLPVYTKMATEVQLAQIYDMDPNFVEDHAEIKGLCAIDASVFVRETGWSVQEFTDEAIKTVSLSVTKKEIKDPQSTFERRKLSTTIKQQQNRSLNQLHRLELNCSEGKLANNPLRNEDFVKALTDKDCLPDFLVVHFGESEAPLEAELSAKIEGLFKLLNQYGHQP